MKNLEQENKQHNHVKWSTNSTSSNEQVTELKIGQLFKDKTTMQKVINFYAVQNNF